MVHDTLKLRNSNELIWRYSFREEGIKTHETALDKMLHHISSSLYAVSDKAICRTKTAKVAAHPIEATCAGCCGENLQAASGKQI